jgi:hypothetical protein
MASNPVIAEFQALNNSTIQDIDGDYEDWAEISNPNPEPMNLNGYYLTDDPADLTKWRFPSLTIPAGDEVLVFASGKDRRNPAEQLHTNFRLSGDGEYLALVNPDGRTIAHEYKPQYPSQIEDQSYGLARERIETVLLDGQDPVKVFVPTNDSLGTTWTQPGFDDASWTSGTTAVGYEQLSTASTVRDDFDGPLSADWNVDIPAGGTSTVTIEGGKLKIVAPPEQSALDGRGTAPIVYRELSGSPANYEIVTHVETGTDTGAAGITIYDATAGQAELIFQYNNRARFEIIDNDGVQLASRNSSRRQSYFMRLARDGYAGTWTGYYKVNEADNWTTVGTITDDVDLPFIEQPRVGLLANTAATGVTALFDYVQVDIAAAQPVYGPGLGLDVRTQMLGKNSSIYMRIPFNVVGDPSRFDELNLSAQFDDGFVAYLNGTRITEQNVPAESTWNSQASGQFGAVGSRIPTRKINAVTFLSALRPGANVLAIHAMNAGANDSDFYFNITNFEANEVISESAQFFVSPTPGDSNELPSAPTPKIEGEQGVFFGEKVVKLSLDTQSPTFEIHYTLDGSDPTLESPLYTDAGVTLTASAMFQARTFDVSPNPDFETSSAASGTFFALDSELLGRDSNLPIIILDSLGQRNLPNTSSTSLQPTNVLIFDRDRTTNRASIGNGDVNYLGRGGLRDRGSTSANQPKPNMAFETWGASGTTQDDDENVSILGMEPGSDWIFYASTSYDPTLFHNQYAFDLSNQIGQWAPDYKNVEVYFNRRDGIVTEADYAGVYAIYEKPDRGVGRIDIDAMSPDVTATPEQNPDGPNISGGYIWKIDRPDPDAPSPFTAGGQAINWVYPKDPESRTARPDQKATAKQEQWVVEYFNAFRTTLRAPNGPDINDPEGYSKYIDVNSWIEHHLLNVLLFNVDALRLSAYFYKDRNEKVVYGPVFDFDRALNSTDGRDRDPFVWRSVQGDRGTDFFGNGTQQWWGDLFKDPGFWQAYVDKFQELRDKEFSDENLYALVDKLGDEIREGNSRTCTVCRHIRPRGGYDAELNALKVWLSQRAGFMAGNFAPPVVVTVNDVEQPRTATGMIVPRNTQVSVVPEPLEVFNDTPFFNDANGGTVAKYFIPTNDDLGTSWTAPGFNDASWSSGAMGFGFGTSGSFPNHYTTMVQPNAVNAEATNFLVRVPFNVASLADVENLVLRMKYDDGYVAYLNGTEIARRNVPDGSISWDTRGTNHANTDAIEFEDVDISEHLDKLLVGQNVLAIRAVNSSASSNDMLLQPSVVNRKITFEPRLTGTVYYTTDGTDPRGPNGSPSPTAKQLARGEKVSVSQNTRIIARNFDDSDRGTESRIVLTDWSGPITYNLIVEQPSLAITEINYNPAAPTAAELAVNSAWTSDDFEFLEIRNLKSTPASLVGVELTDGIEFDFYGSGSSMSTIAPNGYAVVVKNKAAFQQRYGSTLPVAGEFSGNLANTGEDVDLRDGTGATMVSAFYSDNELWPARADGAGGTLELINPNSPAALHSKHYSWRGSREYGGTPGTAGAGPVGVVINEVLSRTDAPIQEPDSIELYNPTGAPIDISGWYLSDSEDNLLKYKIPAGTVIGAGGYLVFTERNFDAGASGFGLNGTEGDQVWLVRADAQGTVVGFVDEVSFGGTANGESLGRTPNGTGRLAPMEDRTFGRVNSDPRVGPVVITEINYNPTEPTVAAKTLYPNLQPSDLEFIEIYNPTAAPVALADWRLRGGVDHDFRPGSFIFPKGTVVVVSFDVDDPENAARVQAFRTHYNISDNVVLMGGYQGLLNNSDERVRLLQPDAPPAGSTEVSHFMADEVIYDDLSPWPIAADGYGASLHRVATDAFGNAGASWLGAFATPGLPSGRIPGDSNLDGIFNSSDLVLVFTAGQYEDAIPGNSTFATGDWNGDGDFTTSDLVLAFQYGAYSQLAIPSDLGVAGIVGQTSDDKAVAEGNHRRVLQSIPDSQRRAAILDAISRDKIFGETDADWSQDEDGSELGDLVSNASEL